MDNYEWGHSDGNETTDPVTPHLRALDAVHPEDIAFQDLIEAGITTVLTGPGSANLIGGQWICVKTAVHLKTLRTLFNSGSERSFE